MIVIDIINNTQNLCLVVVGCGPLDKPNHGDIIEQVGLTFGNRIVFECKDKGYEMKGSRIRTCQSDGTWSGSLTTCESKWTVDMNAAESVVIGK